MRDKPRILVVDDTPAHIKTLAEMLHRDYDLRVAINGAEALTIAMNELPDLILLDVMMPGMDGYEVCRNLKADEDTADIPIIFITVMSGDEDEATGLALGAVDYVTKPFEPSLVMARVRNHLELKRHRDHLEELVRIRTRKLRIANEKLCRHIVERKKSQMELLAAKQAAEAASSSKTEFLANMSHEIRTPMNGIMGMVSLMQTTGLTEEQQEYAAMALQSCDRLTRLLTDILDLSSLEARRVRIEKKILDIAEVMQQVADLYRPLAMETGVELRHNISPELQVKVLGDASRLQQVLTNIVGNALKFTRSGSVTMEACRLSSTKKGGLRVLFSVSDTGIGIPDDKIIKLFTAFSQVDEGYARQYQGAGLGLSICNRLVGLMGGSIVVESEPNVGTTIHFSVTFDMADAGDAAASPDGRHQPPAFKGVKALMAEDDHISGMVAAKFLTEAGISVMIVDDGKKVLDALRHGRFDLVLMDVQMPVMDGVEATRLIRNGDAGEDNRQVPIIAMTAYAQRGDRERFLKAGMNGYVPKPLPPDAFYRTIERVLGQDGQT